MAAYRTIAAPKKGGSWHVYPSGRKVFVRGGGGGGGGIPSQAASGGVSYDIGGAPIDYEAENRKAVGRQQIALGQASDAYERSQLANEYGFGDTSNPYSRAALLESTYKRNQGSNVTSYAAKGQLYSGALETAQKGATSTYNQGYDALRRNYQKQLFQISQRALNRYAQNQTLMDDATYNSIQRGLTGLGA